MPIPAILGGIAVAGAIGGAVKAIEGLSDVSDAKSIASKSETKLKKAREQLNNARIDANDELRNLGQLKIDIFTHQVKHIVDVLSKMKSVSSELAGFQERLTEDEIKQMQQAVTTSLEIHNGLLSGASVGALVGYGAYGSVGMLASASTGTAISTLSGVASTNATLAWLGGGSLATGGFGMAGGSLVLGGLVTAPALAITGFHLASKGEEALTEAKAYEAKNEELIAKIEQMQTEVKGISISALEQQYVLLRAVKYFEEHIKVNDDSNQEKFEVMIKYGKQLKAILDESVLEKDGTPTTNMRGRCEGHIKMSGVF